MPARVRRTWCYARGAQRAHEYLELRHVCDEESPPTVQIKISVTCWCCSCALQYLAAVPYTPTRSGHTDDRDLWRGGSSPVGQLSPWLRAESSTSNSLSPPIATSVSMKYPALSVAACIPFARALRPSVAGHHARSSSERLEQLHIGRGGKARARRLLARRTSRVAMRRGPYARGCRGHCCGPRGSCIIA